MKRPNLVNPQNWTPFRSIPIPIPDPIQIPVQPPVQPSVPEIEFAKPTYISKRELFQKNSFYLNLFAMMVILGIAYFLYSIYLERKIFSEYLDYVRNVQEEHYPGFL